MVCRVLFGTCKCPRDASSSIWVEKLGLNRKGLGWAALKRRNLGNTRHCRFWALTTTRGMIGWLFRAWGAFLSLMAFHFSHLNLFGRSRRCWWAALLGWDGVVRVAAGHHSSHHTHHYRNVETIANPISALFLRLCIS